VVCLNLQTAAISHLQDKTLCFAVEDKRNQTLLHSPLFNEFCEQIKKHHPKFAVIHALADVNPAVENHQYAA